MKNSTDPSTIGRIDRPRDGDLIERHAFQVEGWAYSSEAGFKDVEVVIEGAVVGSSRLSFSRDDVADAYGNEAMRETGFAVLCSVPEYLRDRPTLQCTIQVNVPGYDPANIGQLWLRLSRHDYRQHGHGSILSDGEQNVLRRGDVYGSGPPSPLADQRCVDLVRRYLAIDDRLLDVGCGIGAYGRVLSPLGYDWTGCEVRPDFIEQVRSAGLRGAVVEVGRIPFPDEAFDAALCIEVLEHIDDYAAFIADVRRVVRKRAVFSVPNFEALPVMSSRYAIPWHMLESDHKNFFTTKSLRRALSKSFRSVEVLEYGPLDRFQSDEGLQINNHLFAVADT